MAYIYKITNDINDKIYVGKTEFSIEKRFQEHCKDSKKERCEKRPLYNAMNKYGIEHFHIELIEETDGPEEREKYWIEFYGSFKYGYNATIGGDGKKFLDYDLIYNTYLNTKNVKETARLCHCSEKSVTLILKKYQVSLQKRSKNQIVNSYKPVAKLNKDTEEIIQVYTSIKEAEKDTPTGKHITDVCKGRRKTAGGYKWKYL